MRSPNSSNVTQCYSVFVGHLALGVTKADLRDLFEDCGNIVESYIQAQPKEMCFTYGFVRFRHLADAKRSIKDLNGWMLKGFRITVEIAKETLSSLKSDSKDMPPSKVQQTPLERPAPRRSQGETRTDNMVGLKNLARLRDSCSVVNFDLSRKNASENPIDMGDLLKGVSEETYSRPPAQASRLYDVDCSVEKCVQQLNKCHCSRSCVSNKKANQLVKSMRLIVNNISDYLDNIDVGVTDHETEDDSETWNESNSDLNPTHSTSEGTSSQAEKTGELVDYSIKDELKTVIRSPSSEDDSGNFTDDLTLRSYSSSDDSFSYVNKFSDPTIKRVLGRGRHFSGAKQVLNQHQTSRFIGRGCALISPSETK